MSYCTMQWHCNEVNSMALNCQIWIRSNLFRIVFVQSILSISQTGHVCLNAFSKSNTLESRHSNLRGQIILDDNFPPQLGLPFVVWVLPGCSMRLLGRTPNSSYLLDKLDDLQCSKHRTWWRFMCTFLYPSWGIKYTRTGLRGNNRRLSEVSWRFGTTRNRSIVCVSCLIDENKDRS